MTTISTAFLQASAPSAGLSRETRDRPDLNTLTSDFAKASFIVTLRWWPRKVDYVPLIRLSLMFTYPQMATLSWFHFH